MKRRTEINVANDFSAFPFGRYPKEGQYSGEAFREKIAAPALASGAVVVFNFDGVRGSAPSFLEEAFGGLIRKAVRNGLDPDDLIARIEIVSPNDPFIVKEISLYMAEARKGSPP